MAITLDRVTILHPSLFYCILHSILHEKVYMTVLFTQAEVFTILATHVKLGLLSSATAHTPHFLELRPCLQPAAMATRNTNTEDQTTHPDCNRGIRRKTSHLFWQGHYAGRRRGCLLGFSITQHESHPLRKRLVHKASDHVRVHWNASTDKQLEPCRTCGFHYKEKTVRSPHTGMRAHTCAQVLDAQEAS